MNPNKLKQVLQYNVKAWAEIMRVAKDQVLFKIAQVGYQQSYSGLEFLNNMVFEEVDQFGNPVPEQHDEPQPPPKQLEDGHKKDKVELERIWNLSVNETWLKDFLEREAKFDNGNE